MGKHISISEIYGPVLQGEGPVAGRATIFVRVFGCDSRCRQCDSLYAVDSTRDDAKFRKMTPTQIADEVNQIDRNLPVTFTGGNPAIWDLGPVLDELGLRPIWIETQGTYWRDWITRCQKVIVSPKGPFMEDTRHGLTSIQHLKTFYLQVYQELYFKVVIESERDLDYAETIARVYPSVPMYLSLGNPIAKKVSATTLLLQYKDLGELLLSNRGDQWSRLRNRAVFLPQLHTLVYGLERAR